MKIAYVILAHNVPEHFFRLVNRLSHPDDMFFVHVDKETDINIFKNQGYSQNSKIQWIKNRENGQWGGLGIVCATINALKEIASSTILFDHIILLSGVDYPIKSLNQIRSFYKENKNNVFITYEPFPIERLSYKGMDRIEYYSTSIFGKRGTFLPKSWIKHYSIKGKIFNYLLGIKLLGKPPRKFPYNWTPYYGSQWWSISNNALMFVLEFLNKNPDYIKYHKYSQLPDEFFFQSIFLNTYPHKEYIVNDNKRLIKFDNNSSHPKTYNNDDLDELINCEKFFARKFKENSEILNSIDKMTL